HRLEAILVAIDTDDVLRFDPQLRNVRWNRRAVEIRAVIGAHEDDAMIRGSERRMMRTDAGELNGDRHHQLLFTLLWMHWVSEAMARHAPERRDSASIC